MSASNNDNSVVYSDEEDDWSDDNIGSNDDNNAPIAVSFSQSTEQHKNTLKIESIEQARHSNLSKKRKPKWAQKSTQIENAKQRQYLSNQITNDTNNEESKYDMDNDEDDNDNSEEPPLKRQRLNQVSKKKTGPQVGWITESDMFASKEMGNEVDTNDIFNKLTESNNLSKANLALFNTSDESGIAPKAAAATATGVSGSTAMTESKDENSVNNTNNTNNEKDEMDDMFDDIPFEILEEFNNAINESSSKAEIRDKWKEILRKSSQTNSNLKKKLSKFDKLFVENGMFEIKVHDTQVKNVSALKRALRMKTFNLSKHRRQDYDKQRSLGRYGPSYHFSRKYNINKNRNKKNSDTKLVGNTVWGKKNAQMKKKSANDDLNRWLSEW